MGGIGERISWRIDRPNLNVFPGYCPYCNKFTDPKNMTVEHVIPKAIQLNAIKIFVCKQCNDFMGHKVDVLISRQTMLRILGTSSKSHATLHEQHQTQAILKDGRTLEGYLTIDALSASQSKFAFTPLKKQPDGTQWILAESVRKLSGLPPEIQILYREAIDDIKIPIIAPLENMETMVPAFAKIFLGFAYSAWGYEALSCPSFDLIREYIHGKKDLDFMVAEIGADGKVKHYEERMTPPRPLIFPNHLLWGDAVSGKLVGGVSLFAKVAMCITIPDFDLDLEGRSAEVANHCGGVIQLIYSGRQIPTRQELLNYAEKRDNDDPKI